MILQANSSRIQFLCLDSEHARAGLLKYLLLPASDRQKCRVKRALLMVFDSCFKS